MALALSKGVICLNQYGDIIDDNKIDFILNNRHISRKLRNEKGIYSKIKKRTKDDNILFENNLKKLLEKLL